MISQTLLITDFVWRLSLPSSFVIASVNSVLGRVHIEVQNLGFEKNLDFEKNLGF